MKPNPTLGAPRANLVGALTTPTPRNFRDPHLALETRVNALVDQLTLEEKIEMLHQYQPAVDRLALAPYKHGTEAAHGIAWLGQATSFPQPTGLASTWDPDLVRQVGAAIGAEARGFYRRDPAQNGLTLWAPTVDLERDPRWGRTEEAYGEDPYLVAETAGALVRGIQGDHPVYLQAAATLKHFLGNNHEANRGTVSATLDPRNLNEYFLRPFEAIFRQAGAVSMMTAYNAVNGVPCNLNPDVLKRAKRQWGCGFVVSDAGDVVGTNREHRWFSTLAEAVAANLKAGIDSITDDRMSCLAAVRDALRQGLLAEGDIDEAVRNSLRVRFRLGEFDPAGLNPYETLGDEQIGSAAHRDLSRRAAEESIVLLKNDGGVLPLDPAVVKSIAVVGPLSDVLLRDWYSGEATHQDTVARALARRFASVIVEPASDLVHLGVAGRGAVGASGEGPLAAGGAPRTFRMTDWGWKAHTFEDPKTRRFLTTDDTHLTVTATEVFGWFTKEVFLVDTSKDRVAMATWNALPVKTAEDGTLVTVPRDDLGPGRIGIDGGTAGAQGLAAVKDLCGPLTLTTVEAGEPRAVAAARQADAAVVVIGCHPLINAKETVDRTELTLPPGQIRLVRAVAAANPRTIVVLVSGYPYALDGILDVVPAVVHTTHAGPEFASAVAAVLDGTVNPAGRTCLTWYRGDQRLPPLADYDVMRGGRTYRWFTGQPQFPFGHGLSYTRFDYESLGVVQGAKGPLVHVRVTNRGGRAGDEVVQLYAAWNGRVPHPRQQLVGFRRLNFAPGESKVVTFTIDPDELRHWDPSRDRWVLDEGVVTFSAGPSSGDLRVGDTWLPAGEAPADRDLTVPTRISDWDDHDSGVLDYCREGGSAAGFRWAAYHRAVSAKAPRSVEVRVSSIRGGTVELRWDAPNGPLAATVEVPPARPGELWRTRTATVEGWTKTGSVYLLSTVPVGRDQGVSWFRLVP